MVYLFLVEHCMNKIRIIKPETSSYACLIKKYHYGMVSFGMVPFGMVPYGMVHYGMVGTEHV